MDIELRKGASVCLAMLLLLSACAPAATQPTPEPVTLRVRRSPFLSYAPFFIAEEEGYFAEQGLQIEWVAIQRPPDAVPLLAQGEMDVSSDMTTVGLVNAMAQGAKIKFVADKGYLDPAGCTYNALIASRALVEAGELEGPAQLKGRKIDAKPVLFEGYWVGKLLASAGLTFDDVELVDIDPAVEPEALNEGSVHLTVSSEPWVTRILQSGNGVVWRTAQEVLPGSQFATIQFGPSLLEQNPDAGKRFMVAYLKGVRQYNEGKTERNLEIVAKYTELDRELLEQACWLPIDSDGSVNVKSILEFQDWAVEEGYIDSPASEEQIWDPSFIDYANEVLGK